MNQSNMSKTPSSSGPELPVKRKRGRPRKDESMSRNERSRQIQTSISPSQPPTHAAIQPPKTIIMNPAGDNHNMVGQVVTGVIDGLFDAGYLISVRVGPNNTLLRGLVFQQGHFCPITPTNDIAPNIHLSRRENYQVPITNQTHLCTPQASCAKQPPQLPMQVPMQNYQTNPMNMMTGGGSNSSLPPENLRMVGQDELMNVFEVSKMVEEPPKNDDCGRVLKNDHLLSDSDIITESFHKNDVMNHPHIQDIDRKSSIYDANEQKQLEGEYLGSLTCVEPPPSFEIDESEKQGEVSKIDVNQVPNQGVATDLFQTD